MLIFTEHVLDSGAVPEWSTKRRKTMDDFSQFPPIEGNPGNDSFLGVVLVVIAIVATIGYFFF